MNDSVGDRMIEVRDKVETLIHQTLESQLTLEELSIYYFHLRETAQEMEPRGHYNTWCEFQSDIVSTSILRRCGCSFTE